MFYPVFRVICFRFELVFVFFFSIFISPRKIHYGSTAAGRLADSLLKLKKKKKALPKNKLFGRTESKHESIRSNNVARLHRRRAVEKRVFTAAICPVPVTISRDV